MPENLIIDFAPTGMIPTKEMTPYVPISVSEIIEDVHETFELGISMVHLHARVPLSGRPTYKAKIYGEIIEGIRKFSSQLIICVSLSGRDFPEFEKRSEPLDVDGNLKPDMGSMTLVRSISTNKLQLTNQA
jgi:3-keto-5-aminohexanoate cleavage enzyme